jgi:hypothetical protein
MAADNGTGRFFGLVLAVCLLDGTDAALSAPGVDPASIAKALPAAARATNTKLPKNSLRMIGLQAALLQPREPRCALHSATKKAARGRPVDTGKC